MNKPISKTHDEISPWWKHSLIIIMILSFSVLIWLSTKAYTDAPPIPDKTINSNGDVVFTKTDIMSGQKIFLKYGLMENGSIWGHGAYLGPDFSAEYLHRLSEDLGEDAKELKRQNYNPKNKTLTLSDPEINSYQKQIGEWKHYFSDPSINFGLPANYITDPEELRQLTSFFAWTAWASVTNRPGKNYSYTNNFPYDPSVGNVPTGQAILWSALSLITLLGGIGIILLAFGKFNFLGWQDEKQILNAKEISNKSYEVNFANRKATIKFFAIVPALFLLQAILGGAVAHFRSDPGSFYGIDISSVFPSNLLRTWHLQLAIFWIATAYVAGGLFLSTLLNTKIVKGQKKWIDLLFVALIVVVLGSMFGEFLGINNLLGTLWFWLGHQGWEYLDLGRFWQVLLAIALVGWIILLFRAVDRKDPELKQVVPLFLYAAAAIPIFYLPAFFFSGDSHFSIADTWRFWIIHLWVEGFFELFVTVMVAIIFYRLGVVSKNTAVRVIYLDAILYLGSGIVGTGHHWYWSGLSSITMGLGAMFSAMEVVPLTLLTLDAWDFIKITDKKNPERLESSSTVKYRWTFYFLMAVGFWNFLGAGVFGFLINLPIISYFEVGTLLTPNHGHAAMMGVFGMLAIALIVFALRSVLDDEQWKSILIYIKLSFWGINIGLLIMVLSNLFPGGVLQLLDVLNNGYWHARSPAFLNQDIMRTIEWMRLPGDFIFITLGCIPLVIGSTKAYFLQRKNPPL